MNTSKSHGQDYDLFANKIIHLREHANYTQSQVSKLLDIAQSTYAGYEMGVRKIPLSLIKKIASLYNVSADFLLSDTTSNDMTFYQSNTTPQKEQLLHLADELNEHQIESVLAFAKYLQQEQKNNLHFESPKS